MLVSVVGTEQQPKTVESESTDELYVPEALVEAKKQRHNSNEQLGRDAQALLYVESERPSAGCSRRW